MKKQIVIAILITVVALSFRLFLALKYPNDWPGDAKTYALLAKNVMERGVYSSDAEEPYNATYFRVPGYPVFLIACFRLFGTDNDRPIRVIQAVMDTLSCWLVALLALAWSPAEWEAKKRRRAMLIALALAAICPFNAVYVTVLLTEVLTTFSLLLSVLAATNALKGDKWKRSALWWFVAGISGGAATMLRPDAALFTGAIGLTLVLIRLTHLFIQWRKSSARMSEAETGNRPSARQILWQTVLNGAILSIGFAAALTPWTVRNFRVFGVFMPIAPASASMPGEFVATGYGDWLKTWVDNWYYTEKVDWVLDTKPITIGMFPAYAFDSEEEKAQVAALLEQYDNPDRKPPAPEIEKNTGADDDDTTSDDDSTGDDDDDDSDEAPAVEMTPQIDAQFEQIARERIARHPFRYYVTTRLRRAYSMWFSSHSEYYPFSGDYWFGIDRSKNQHIWIPLFVALSWLYTILGFAGIMVMWKYPDTRRWILLLFLLIVPRFAYLTTLQNPEPRYVVEYFPFLLAAAGLALAGIKLRRSAKNSEMSHAQVGV